MAVPSWYHHVSPILQAQEPLLARSTRAGLVQTSADAPDVRGNKSDAKKTKIAKGKDNMTDNISLYDFEKQFPNIFCYKLSNLWSSLRSESC